MLLPRYRIAPKRVPIQRIVFVLKCSTDEDSHLPFASAFTADALQLDSRRFSLLLGPSGGPIAQVIYISIYFCTGW